MSQEISKTEFLKFAIEDAQEGIRFIDAKTAFAVTIIGGYVVGIVSTIDKTIKYFDKFSPLYWILYSIFLLLVISATIVTARIIKPTSNPLGNIDINNTTLPNLKFYISGNNYSSWFYRLMNDKSDKLSVPYNTYLNDINNSNVSEIIEVLTMELLKVSYIRNIKNDRFNFLVVMLVVCSVLFVMFYLLYSIETQHAATLLLEKSKQAASNRVVIIR